MKMSAGAVRAVALLVTFFTGFTGLVYEVTWQKYLATLLGSHSEATASILGIFLGGLAVGYRLFGNVTRNLLARADNGGRPARLLARYGYLEISIGLYAMLFPLIFLAVQTLSFNIPHSSGGPGFVFDVILSVLLIGFPTVLMGGTIPFLTQGLARNLNDATRVHSFVYAYNTAGAFAGALAAAFLLIPKLGLVWVMFGMGAINLFAGAIFIYLDRVAPSTAAPVSTRMDNQRNLALAGYAAVALLTGFAMMTVQTAAIRIGALSLGSSDLTFAMVVAIFVLCIALGSFMVSVLPRIPRWTVLVNQWLLAGALLWLYVKLPQGPYLAHQLRILFTSREDAFMPYQIGVFAGTLSLLFVPVLLSGASLPLLFNHLRDKVGDLGAVAGRLYSWNTVGSFLGALLGGYALLFWLDLHVVYRIGVLAAVVAAALLGVLFASMVSRAASLLLAVLAIVTLGSLSPWTAEKLSPGLFRASQALPYSSESIEPFLKQWWGDVTLPFYRDDPTASVLVSEIIRPGIGPVRSILVNGKSDSATHGERPTVGLLGVLPALFARQAERAFVIGYGTGFTVGEIAALDENREVIVAEISPGVIDAAPLFDFANRNASSNPKVTILRSDAYRALLRGEGQFDIIVSEPSNPWVTGVEMLYSVEFLRAARDRLAPGGVFVQWFHQYATSDAAASLVLKSYAETFDHVAVWYGLGHDLLLLGFDDPVIALDIERLEKRARQKDFAEGLRRSEVDGFAGLLAHEIMPLGVLHTLELDGPVQTLLHPRLNNMTARAYFEGSVASLPFSGSAAGKALGEQNSLLRRYFAHPSTPKDARRRATLEACKHRTSLCTSLFADWYVANQSATPEYNEATKLAVKESTKALGGRFNPREIPQLVSALMVDGEMPARVPYALAKRATRMLQTYYHHAVPMNTERLLQMWERCTPPAKQPDACSEGLAEARELLGVAS